MIPERTALVTPARRLTYRALDERANQLAHHLRELGVRAGDHLGLQLLNGTEFIEGMLAAFKLSAVPVNVNYRYVERELEYLFDRAREIKARFKELVKRHHPDANGGDRGSEDRLREIIQAYNYLKQAGLV